MFTLRRGHCLTANTIKPPGAVTNLESATTLSSALRNGALRPSRWTRFESATRWFSTRWFSTRSRWITPGVPRSVGGLFFRLLATLLTLCVLLASRPATASDQTASDQTSSDQTSSGQADVAGADASDVGLPPASSVDSDSEGETGVPQRAAVLIHVLGLPITNSMVVMWVVSLFIIVFAQIATRDMRLIPSGVQNFWEWLVGSLRDLLADLLGEHLVDRTFWFFASTFIFILATNWSSLIPGMSTIGWGHTVDGSFRITEPLFRAPNADLNMTLAMALVFFGWWFYWAISEHGVWGFLKERFGPKGDSRGLMGLIMALIFFAVGCLEIISIVFRPVSLSFRLYGNIFAGENILEVMGGIVPRLNWLLPIPFYFMELLVGVVQALVFMMLTAVFVLLDCRVEEHEQSAC